MNNDNLTPYETYMIENGDYVHQAVQDMLTCKLEAIRKTSVRDMTNILDLFIGSSQQVKKDQLVEFLKLMPEYKTTDKEVLYRRLKGLQEYISRTEGNSDLFFYALRKYKKTNENTEEE